MLNQKATNHDLALSSQSVPHVKEHVSICLNSHLVVITVANNVALPHS